MWSYWKLGLLTVAVAVTAFATFLGGPLYFNDEVEATAGVVGSVVISGLPVLVAGVCAFSLWPTHPWSLGGWAVLAGLLAIALISAMNAFTVTQILAKWPSTDGELVVAGVAAGSVSALAYLILAIRRLRKLSPKRAPVDAS